VDYALSMLTVVAGRNNLLVSDEARKYFETRLAKEFTEEAYRRYFVERDTSASRRFGEGVENVSELACSLAQAVGHRFVTQADIEESIRRRFCSVWPFCK
jgi:histone H3/H4